MTPMPPDATNAHHVTAIPGSPIPDGAVTGKITTPDGVELRFARWASPAGARERSASSADAASSSKNISRRRRTAGARLCGRDDGLARDRGTPRGNCPIRARGMSKASRSSRSTSRRSCSKWCLPIVRRPILRWRTRWAARSLLRSAHSGKRWFERTVLVSPMIDFPRRPRLAAGAHSDADAAPRRLWQLLRSGRQYRSGDGHRALPKIRSPPIPCVMPVMSRSSSRIQRSELARQRWPGWMRRLNDRWHFGPRITRRRSISLF